MKRFIYLIIVIIVIAVLFVYSSRYFLPKVFAAVLAKQLRAEIAVEEALLNGIGRIRADRISIKNREGLSCQIASCDIEYKISSILREGINFAFNLKDVKLSYPDSAVINTIATALSVKQLDILSFDTVSGRIYFKERGLIVRQLSAEGEHIKLYVDGTLKGNSRINCSFRIFLSAELVASIPEATRKTFFKEGGTWSEVGLYISGDTRHPSINFSTDLFKLIVR